MDPIDPWVDAEEVRKLAQSLLMPINREPESRGEVCFGDEFVGFAGPEIPVQSVAPAPAATAAPVATVTARANEPDPAALQHIQEQARESLAIARERAEHGGLLERSPAPALASPQHVPTPTPPDAPQTSPADPAARPEPQEAETPPTKQPSPEPRTPAVPEIPPPTPPVTAQVPFVERLHAYGQWLQSAVQAKAFFVTDRDGHVLMDQVRSAKLLQVARTLAQASQTANRHAGGSAVDSLHVKLGESSILEVLPVDTAYGPLILGIVVPSVLSSPAIKVISSGLEQVVATHSG